MCQKAPILFNKSKANSWNYVFLINNPIAVFISKILIEKFKLDIDKVKVFSFRNTDASLITNNYIKVFHKKYDSVLGKIFWCSPLGNRILKKLPDNKFILFTEWSYRESERIINHKNCVTHAYIEMGQHSYLNIPVFSPKKLSFRNRFLKNWKNRLSPIDEYAHYYFRDDASLFFGMMTDVFPKIENEKKYILDNFSDLKQFYKPKLIGNKVIGLTCASRRIERKNWDDMLNKLFKKLPPGSLIKAHPSFYSNEAVYKDFFNTFNRLSKGNFELCPNNIILELEILFEKKIFYGSKSALSKYAEYAGSKFNLLNLY